MSSGFFCVMSNVGVDELGDMAFAIVGVLLFLLQGITYAMSVQ